MIEANIEGRGNLIITNDLNHWERNWCFGRRGLITKVNVLSGSIDVDMDVQIQIRDDMIHTPVSGLFDLMARMGMVRWLTRDAIRMAQECYAAADPTTMKILADNIEEHGCDNEELLGHLRSDGLHMKGCWAIDTILSKAQ